MLAVFVLANYCLLSVDVRVINYMALATAALEFGSSKICCVIDTKNIKGTDLPSAATVPFEGIRYFTNQLFSELTDKIATVVEMAERQCGATVRSAIVGAPAEFCNLVRVNIDKRVKSAKVSKQDIDEVWEELMEAGKSPEQLIYCKIAYYLDDYDDVYLDPPIGIFSSTLRACGIKITLDTRFSDIIMDVLSSLKVGTECFVFEDYAQSLKFLPEKVRDSGVIALDSGDKKTSMSVVFGDSILANATINQGAAMFTDDLVNILQVDKTTAENIKRQFVFGLDGMAGEKLFAKSESGKMVGFDEKLIREIIISHMEPYAYTIKKCVTSFYPFVKPDTPLYMFGSGLLIRGMGNYLTTFLGRPVFQVKQPGAGALPYTYNVALALIDNKQHWQYDSTMEPLKKGVLSLLTDKLKATRTY